MRLKKLLNFIILIGTCSCIDPVDIKVSSAGEKLVVDGLISDSEGPYTVKLSKSLPFDNTQVLPVYFVPESGAVVTIEDDLGNSFLFAEQDPGVYKSDPAAFRGEVGRAYKLKIITSGGVAYQSDPEMIVPVPPIDSLIYEYYKYPRFFINSAGTPVVFDDYAFRLSVKVNDPSSERNYYRWKVDGIFEFFSLTDNPEIMQCWAPLSRLEPGIMVTDDRFVDGKPFIEPLAIILYDRPTYFLAMVEQYSLSAEAFEYWNQVKKQQQNTGSIFDSTPAQIKGNIYRTDNTDEMALGYFGATAVTRDSILFQRFKASGLVSPTRPKDIIPGDCRFQEPNATNIKPPGFI